MVPENDPRAEAALIARTRDLFLRDDNTYGCAEAALVALQEHYSLPDPAESGAAMALNGGVAYSGATCGAITGVAMAVGRLAARCIEDHREAKRVARTLVQEVMREFAAEFDSTDCRDLTGFDLAVDHDAFLESDVWRTDCLRQIEFTVARLAPLADRAVWESELARLATG